jgi:hypothetical protein
MPNSDLEALRPVLDALPLEDIDEPDLPMSVLLQEAHDLYAIVKDEPVRSALVAVGVEPEQIDTLDNVINATRAAQSQWVVVRDRHKEQAQRDREEQGYTLRGSLLASCRFNLRKRKKAKATIQAIAEGEGLPDLVQDLVDIAQLIDDHRDAFARDTTFDAGTKSEEARTLSAEIQAGLSSERQGETREQSKDLRDRAFTYLNTQVSDLREAGRYRYRDDRQQSAKFASAYERRRRRRARGAEQDAPATGDAAAPSE